MTTKQEAERLIKKFTFASIYFTDSSKGALLNAKFCAESCVDEMIKILPFPNDEWYEERKSYLQDVKTEINNFK